MAKQSRPGFSFAACLVIGFSPANLFAQDAPRRYGRQFVSFRLDRKIDADELFNDFDASQVALGIWYLW